MIVGEAPGFNEDRQGEPFVGAAGKLLDTLLGRISFSRSDVYITNVLKCRPPMNRDPMPNEAEACSPYLKQQLELVKPKVVLILGRHALERLMPGQGSISRIHGSLMRRGEVAYVPLYHPAAALHNGSARLRPGEAIPGPAARAPAAPDPGRRSDPGVRAAPSLVKIPANSEPSA